MSTIVGRIAGVSPVIDGVFIEIIDDDNGPEASPDRPRDMRVFPMLYEVSRYGGMPVERGTLYINFENITQLNSLPQLSDLESSNPYGRFIGTLRWQDETGLLSVAEFEKCVTLNLRHDGKVEDIVVWRNMLSPDWNMSKIVALYQANGQNIVDLVFVMRELQGLGGDHGEGEA